tara:strand:+ start:518 stop:775 length:258 start_codon:yes stop_codon:yes gene_type:complete
MKETENYEQLLYRFTKRVEQLQAEQLEVVDAYHRWIELDRQLERLEGSIQAIEYVAFGKLPHDGNHEGMKNHKVVRHGKDLDALD